MVSPITLPLATPTSQHNSTHLSTLCVDTAELDYAVASHYWKKIFCGNSDDSPIVASFGTPDLSLIFLSGKDLEVTPLFVLAKYLV